MLAKHNCDIMKTSNLKKNSVMNLRWYLVKLLKFLKDGIMLFINDLTKTDIKFFAQQLFRKVLE